MKARAVLASLYVGLMSLLPLTAGEQGPKGKADDSRQARAVHGKSTERLENDLQNLFQKMLTLQVAVHDGTKRLHKLIENTAGNPPRPADRQVALKLAADEKKIIAIATKALDTLKGDGSAAAFMEVFDGVREDMQRVLHRLEKGDVGSSTQVLQRDVIDTLEEIIKSLRKR